MGALLGLVIGLGLALIGLSLLGPDAPPRTPRPSVVSRQLERAGLVGLSRSAFAMMSLVPFVVVFLAVQVLTAAAPVSIAFAAMAGWLPWLIVSGRARARSREVAQVWPDAVDQLTSGVRAGLSLPEALAGLGVRGPEELRPAFTAFARDYQMSGRFGDCLDRVKQRLADPVGDRVVEGLRIAREVGGGDLGRLLRNLANQLREDLRTRNELEARQAWAVNSARLAVAAPWLVLGLMSFNADTIARYSTTGGAIVLSLGAALCLGAYRLMMRIGALPVERRILVTPLAEPVSSP